MSDRPADLTTRATLLGMVLKMCRSLGMRQSDVLILFSPGNIRDGYAILGNATSNHPKGLT